MKAMFLNDAQCEEIFQTSRRILAEIGCKVENEKARDILKKGGCEVEGQIVKIPQALVEKCVESAPSSFTVYDREGNPAAVLSAEEGESYFAPGVCAIYRTDRKTGERRPANRQDAHDGGLVCEALDNFSFSSGLCYISDVRPELASAYEVRELLETTRKPFIPGSVCLTECKTIIALCAAVRGGMDPLREKPNLIFTVSSTSPLCHTNDNLEGALYAFEQGIPVLYLATPLMCGTSPATLAGTVAQGVADNLVGLVLSQLVHPGNPFLACCFVDAMDMQSMSFAHTSPEISKGAMMATSVFHYLSLPCISHMGCTDANELDAQAAFDITSQLFGSMVTGCNVSMFAGFLETAMKGSLSTLAFADEAIGSMRASLSPALVDEEELAFDTIQEVGPGGDFVAEEHTVDHCYDMWRPVSFQRVAWGKWQEAGSPSYADKAKERVEQILAAGVKKPLPAETLAELDRILEEAEKQF